MALKELSLSHRQISLTKRKKVRRQIALPRNYELPSGRNSQKVLRSEVAKGQVGRFRKTDSTMHPPDSQKRSTFKGDYTNAFCIS